jgi:hypothetical protein
MKALKKLYGKVAGKKKPKPPKKEKKAEEAEDFNDKDEADDGQTKEEATMIARQRNLINNQRSQRKKRLRKKASKQKTSDANRSS